MSGRKSTVDVHQEQIRAGRYFLHEQSCLDPRMIALQKTEGVFCVSSPMCCFKAKIETKNGSRDDNKFVHKPTKSVENSRVLAEALDRRCSNSSGQPYHRHIVLIGGLAKMASAYAPELVDKGDPDRPIVRCRLVGRELRAKTKETLLAHELFTEMPPWEIFKVL